jgi:tRNA G18 (ribose-2'-O)-methylase SpoU
MKTIVVVHNIRSLYNVGSILRTAEGFGVQRVILSGYTPSEKNPTYLPHIREKIKESIHKTALGAEEMLQTEYTGNVREALEKLRADHYKIIGLENNIRDRRLKKLNSPELQTPLGRAATFGNRTVLLLGEEVNGIPEDLYDLVDLFLEIPMKGRKESFNVSVATGITLYKLLCEEN